MPHKFTTIVSELNVQVCLTRPDHLGITGRSDHDYLVGRVCGWSGSITCDNPSTFLTPEQTQTITLNAASRGLKQQTFANLSQQTRRKNEQKIKVNI